MTTTRIHLAAAHGILSRMIADTNGGVMPDIGLYVTTGAAPAMRTAGPGNRRDRLGVVLDGADRLTVTVGVSTSWTTLLHEGFRFARTPGAQLVLIGCHQGRKLHFWFEDDRMWCDAGSPMISNTDDLEAMAAFDAEFAARATEAL